MLQKQNKQQETRAIPHLMMWRMLNSRVAAILHQNKPLMFVPIEAKEMVRSNVSKTAR